MNKLLLINITLLLVMPIIAYGALTDELISYYKLDESAGDALDAHGTNDGTVSGAVPEAIGVINTAYDFAGDNDYIDLGSPATLVTLKYPYTFAAWVKPDDITHNGIVFAVGTPVADANSNTAIGLYEDNLVFGTGDWKYGLSDISNYLTDGVYQHWAFICQGTTHTEFWLDGVNQTLVDVVANYGAGTNINFGARSNGASFAFDGKIDEAGIWNRSLTPAEIATLAGITPYPFDTTPPVISISSPANNTGISSASLNFTATATDAVSNNIICHLRNESHFLDENTTASGAIFNLTYISGKTTIQQANLYNITCWDNDATNNNSASEYLNITLDNVMPVITVTLPLNNTNIDKTFSNLTISALCSDPNGARFNYSMINDIGIVVNSTQNNVASSTMALQHTIGLSGIPAGDYNLNFTCVDDHTYTDAKIVDVYKDEILKKLYYTTKSANDISIQLMDSNLGLCDFSSYPLSDREVFVYDFSCNKEAAGQNYYKFMLRDNYGKLRYLPDSEYKGHFVTDDNFITFDIEKAYYTVKKIGKDYEVIVWTYDTYLEFKNSIGGINKQNVFLNIGITETNFSSVRHFHYTVPHVFIDSGEYQTVFNGTVNFTSKSDIIFRGTGQAQKVQAGEATVTARLKFLGKTILESNIVTISSATDRLSFNFPIVNITSEIGINNFSLEIKENGLGAINLTKVEIVRDIAQSNSLNDIKFNVKNLSRTYSSTSFIKIFNITLDKQFNSPTLVDIHHTFGKAGGGSVTPTCYGQSNITGRTPSYSRYLSGATDVGSSGITFRSTNSSGFEEWGIYCKADAVDTITNSISVMLMEMRDAKNELINGFQNQTSSLIQLTAGETEIVSHKNFIFRNSSEIDGMATIIFQSTSGAQENAESPSFKINSTSIDNDLCSNSIQRSMSGSTDIGTVKFIFSCNSTIGTRTDFKLYATVAAGETLNILNASINSYEIDSRDIIVINVPPTVVIENPLDNTELSGVNEIKWKTIDEDDFTTNITISNSSTALKLKSNLGKGIINTSFNFSTLGDGYFSLNITSTENTTPERFSGVASITIRVKLPAIIVNLTIPANNSVLENGNIGFTFITETTGANCSLYIDNTINHINQSMYSVPGINTFGTVMIENGTHNWLVRCKNETLAGVSDRFYFDVNEISSNLMDLRVCPDTVAGSLILILVVFISLAFIVMGLASKAGVLGFFGAIMLIITSWYISPCIHIFSYVLALFGAFLIFFFIARSFNTNIN